MPEREQEEQEIENLFEQIMKGNFHNLAKELDMQVQEAESPKEVGSKKKHTKTHHKLLKIKDKESLKSSKRKGDSYLQRSAHKTSSWFLQRNLAGKRGLERSIWSHERQGPTSKITLPSKSII